jgi:outer membrane receptor for ferrienterochelin and colicins
MRQGIKGIFMLNLLTLLAGQVFGQQAHVKVTDKLTQEPVSYAHVCFESLHTHDSKHAVTDMKGLVPNDCKEKCKIAISFIGFETLFDTVNPGKSYDFELTPTVLNMKEVVVTAQYTPEKADKSIYRVNVINARQIEQKAAVNMSDLLKNQLNMRVSQDGVLGTNLSIQGLSGEHVKFLVDGVPMVGRMNGNIDLSQLNLNNVDHVEVIEGPMSVIYGSNALAGVVNIITKENKIAAITSHADAYWESVGEYNFTGGCSLNHKKHVFSLEGGRNFFEGYSEKDTSRSMTWKPRRQYFADAYYIFNREKTKLKIGGQYFNELLLSKGALQPPYFETAFDTYFTTIRAVARTEVTRQLSSSYYFHLLGSWSYYDRIKNTYFKDLTDLSKVITTNTEDQDTTGIHSWLVRGTLTRSLKESKWNYQAGIDCNIEEGSGKRILGDHQSIGDYAGFVSFKYDPWKWLTLQPGARIIYNTKYTAPLVYSLSGKWQSTDRLSFRLSFSRGFRSPALKELYLYFVDINHNIQGNKDLKAENSVNMNVTASWALEKKKYTYRVEANIFYNRIKNIITLAQAGSSLYTYINVDKYNTQGAELKLAGQWYPWLSIETGIAHTGRLNSLTTSTEIVEKYRYTTDYTADISFRIPKKEVSLSFYYKYSGKMPQFFNSGDTIYEGFISDYHTLDITLSKSILMNRVKVSVGIKNMFDNKTIAAVGGSGGAHGSGGGETPIGWGRTYFARVSFTFNKYR